MLHIVRLDFYAAVLLWPVYAARSVINFKGAKKKKAQKSSTSAPHNIRIIIHRYKHCIDGALRVL
jgi:hypothetical protein